MESDSWLSWVSLALLLMLAIYFASAETAVASVSRIRLKTQLERGDRRAKKALYIQDHFEKAISAILVGTNVVHISAASLVTVLVTRNWGVSWVALGTVVCTVVIFFVGEMLPKSVAKKYSERWALATADSLYFFMHVLGPVAAVLTWAGERLARLSKGEPEVTVTEDELYDIIESMAEEGELGEERGGLVQSALEFADVSAESVLTSRVDVAALDVSDSPEEILAFIKSHYHSRLPVYEGSIDNIIGILQIRKYIKAYLRGETAPDLRALLDEPFIVHHSTAIDELLEEMNLRKLNMAVVTDSYGGTMGIVTVEDILEELVGEIWDEDDVAEEFFRDLGNGEFELDADLDMEDLFELLDVEDPACTEWNHKRVGEWVYEQFDMLPAEGDSFTYHRFVVMVSVMRHRRILKLRVRLLPRELPEGGAET